MLITATLLCYAFNITKIKFFVKENFLSSALLPCEDFSIHLPFSPLSSTMWCGCKQAIICVWCLDP